MKSGAVRWGRGGVNIRPWDSLSLDSAMCLMKIFLAFLFLDKLCQRFLATLPKLQCKGFYFPHVSVDFWSSNFYRNAYTTVERIEFRFFKLWFMARNAPYFINIDSENLFSDFLASLAWIFINFNRTNPFLFFPQNAIFIFFPIF